jgi:hypothetical protein
MKHRRFTHYFLAALLLVPSVFAGAQTVPGSAFPTAGDIFSLTEADTTGISPGAGGSGSTWNFGSLTNGTGAQADTFMSPSSTPYGSLFPTATIAVHETAPPSTNYYVFYKNDGANSVYQRIANVQPDTVVYTDPANEFPYPLAYSNSYNDTYYGSYPYHGTYAAMAGNFQGSVDGSGTLTLPTGTYSNVLRTHSSRNEQDTVTVSGNRVPLHQTYDYYVWYQPNSYFPILSISTFTLSSAFINKYSKTVAYRAGYATSGIGEINANSNGLMAFPNPSNGDITLTYDVSVSGESVISIYDLTGQMVQTMSHADIAGKMQLVGLHVSQLAAGMYEVRVVNSESSTSTRLHLIR